MSLDVLIRRATQDDVPEILLHRRGMYEDMDYNDGDALSSMLSTCAPYLTTALANGSFQSWLGLIGERIVAVGAISFNPWPSPLPALWGRGGPTLSVFVFTRCRPNGTARLLIR